MSTFPRKQTPAQKIKRLEKQLADEKLRTELLNTMIDMSDERLGTSIRKKKNYPINQENPTAKRSELVALLCIVWDK